jgi:hypothetical protein
MIPSLNFKAKLDGFLDATKELVKRTRLGMTPVEFGNGSQIITFGIPLNDDVELAFHASIVAANRSFGENHDPISP